MTRTGSTAYRFSRRRFLGGIAGAGAALPLTALLAACGGDDDDDDEPEATSEAEASPTEVAEDEPTAAQDGAEPTASEAAGDMPTPTEATGGDVPDVDLAAVKQFTLDEAGQMKAASEELLAAAERYTSLVSAAAFDYEAALADNLEELPGLVFGAREAWLSAHQHYELAEGIVAGVPSLADFDVWIDAGPSAEEDPVEARDWQLELPDGEVLERPGNLFHSLLEPALWGSNEAAVGSRQDLDGDGELGTNDALPEANLLLAAAEAFDGATGEMVDAITAWSRH